MINLIPSIVCIPRNFNDASKIKYKVFGQYNLFSLEFKEEPPKLRLVKIHFGTDIFDKITKDERANFETKLSVVGGTMGLFTGFSLISGIEIIYYSWKTLVGAIIFRKKNT